jgi:hypothetical protein
MAVRTGEDRASGPKRRLRCSPAEVQDVGKAGIAGGLDEAMKLTWCQGRHNRRRSLNQPKQLDMEDPAAFIEEATTSSIAQGDLNPTFRNPLSRPQVQALHNLKKAQYRQSFGANRQASYRSRPTRDGRHQSLEVSGRIAESD